jgi:hypothetical protein
MSCYIAKVQNELCNFSKPPQSHTSREVTKEKETSREAQKERRNTG